MSSIDNLSSLQEDIRGNDCLECFTTRDPHFRRIYQAFHLQLVRTAVVYVGPDVLRIGKNLMNRRSRPRFLHVREHTLAVEIKGKILF